MSKEPLANVKATYKIIVENTINESRDKKIVYLTLWRYNNTVAQKFSNKSITDVWHKTKNNRLMYTKAFNDYQRSIEYDPIDIKTENYQALWSEKSELFPYYNAFDLVDKHSNTYEHNEKGIKQTLVWLKEQSLPQSYTVSDKTKKVTWELTELSISETELKQYFDTISNYSSTDYADVGDNESDPFLAKMIHLGFVEHSAGGFYDSQGNQSHAGHNH